MQNKSNSWLRSLVKLLAFLSTFCLILAYLSPFVHPQTISFVPFFGLIYPILLTVQILFFLLFLLLRDKWLWYILLSLVLGGNLHFRFYALGSESDNNHGKEAGIHVMSYNVRLFGRYSDNVMEAENIRRGIFNFLENENADVYCFQEFYAKEGASDFPTKDSLIPLLKIEDWHERFSQRRSGRHNFGVMTLSKYPIISKGEVPLQDENYPYNDNYCIFTDIVKNQDTFRVYNVHLQSIKLRQDDTDLKIDSALITPSNKAKIKGVLSKLMLAYEVRADQAIKIIDHTKDSPYPIIVCGDFNDTPLSYSYNQFSKQFKDAFRESSTGIGATYIGKIPAGRIDYIFHDKDLNEAFFKVQKEEWSDHRAISCVIFKSE